MHYEQSSEFSHLPPITYEMKVGLTVRAMRNYFGMSQTQLAELCDVVRPTISSLERGGANRHANANTLEKVIRVFEQLGVEVELDGKGMNFIVSELGVYKALIATRQL